MNSGHEQRKIGGGTAVLAACARVHMWRPEAAIPAIRRCPIAPARDGYFARWGWRVPTSVPT
jgi:hypothetical protein